MANKVNEQRVDSVEFGGVNGTIAPRPIISFRESARVRHFEPLRPPSSRASVCGKLYKILSVHSTF